MVGEAAGAPVYDLAIIGGGINGCGIARDAAGRGLRVLLVEQAKGQLDGDATAASRVVERAFVRMWRDRGAIAAPEAFEGALNAAVHETAVRERSRLAGLQRFGAASGKTIR